MPLNQNKIMSSTTFLVLNSGCHQFRIHYDGYVFVLNGNHGFEAAGHEDFENERFHTAEELITYVKTLLTLWCSITILQKEFRRHDLFSFHVVHRFFKNRQEERSEIIKTINALKEIDTYFLLFCLTKRNVNSFLLLL